MLQAPIPKDEQIRQTAVENLKILNTAPEERFDKITKEAQAYFKAPMCTISILDNAREWYKSCQGMCNTKEGSRDISFCGHALLSKFIFIIEDTLLDSRFADNPYVTGFPYIRFYAGMRLLDRISKQPIGVFCIKDIKPRHLNPTDIAIFLDFSNRAEEEINSTEIIRSKA